MNLSMVAGMAMAIVTGFTWVVVGVVSSGTARRGANSALVQWLTQMLGMVAVAGILAFKGAAPFREAFVPGMKCLWATLAFAGFGFINYYMLAAMNEAMRRGPHGMAWTITQSGFILPFLMICVVFPGRAGLTAWRAIGILAILFNVVVDGVSKGSSSDGGKSSSKSWFWIALLALFLCGANQCCAELPSYLPEGAYSERLGVEGRMAWSGIGALIAWAIHAIFRSGPRRLAAPWPEFRAALLGALAITVVNTAVSYFLFYPCMDRLADAGVGAIAHPLMVGACFCGFFIYSAFFLRERTTALQKIGFAVGLAGVALQCL